MPRSVRIEYAGAVYHVLCRGDRREPIFRDEQDYRCFLDTLAEMCKRTGIRIHAYVLMGNHYHLLLETPEPNLVVGMKWFQGTYTQRFNRRHRLSGHLFQGRYKAIPIEAEDDEYFRVVSDYIHLNPARAHLLNAKKPKLIEYAWSSFPRFVKEANLPEWLTRDRVLASQELPDEGSGSRRCYKKYLELRTAEVLGQADAGALEEEWKALRRGWYVGSDTFRDRLQDLADRRTRGRKRASYRSEGLQLHDKRAAGRLLNQALEQVEERLSGLRKRKQTDPKKQAVAWWVKSRSAVSDAWLSAKLKMGSRTNIHRAVAAYRDASDSFRKAIKRKLELCAD